MTWNPWVDAQIAEGEPITFALLRQYRDWMDRSMFSRKFNYGDHVSGSTTLSGSWTEIGREAIWFPAHASGIAVLTRMKVNDPNLTEGRLRVNLDDGVTVNNGPEPGNAASATYVPITATCPLAGLTWPGYIEAVVEIRVEVMDTGLHSVNCQIIGGHLT